MKNSQQLCPRDSEKIALSQPDRIGNEVSERQWEDVTRLIRLLGDQADWQYMKKAAELLGVVDLLERLRENR